MSYHYTSPYYLQNPFHLHYLVPKPNGLSVIIFLEFIFLLYLTILVTLKISPLLKRFLTPDLGSQAYVLPTYWPA